MVGTGEGEYVTYSRADNPIRYGAQILFNITVMISFGAVTLYLMGFNAVPQLVLQLASFIGPMT